MQDHPILIPKVYVEVRWLRHMDGKCHAREFYDENTQCQSSLLALARQVAVKGRVGKVPENGHPLQPPYKPLIELKPNDFRFMGFRDGMTFYLVNGAPKKRNQNADYSFALTAYNFFKNDNK